MFQLIATRGHHQGINTMVKNGYVWLLGETFWNTFYIFFIDICVCVYIYTSCIYIYIYPGSSVGIATDYGLDGPGSNPGGDEIFRPSRPALGATQPPIQWVPGLSRGQSAAGACC